MTTPLFDEMKSISQLYNEKNDCAVKAVAIATLTPYNIVHSVFKKRGRIDRRGPQWKVFNEVLEEFGIDKKENSIPLEFNKKGISVNKIGQYLPKGTYICYTRAHVLALVDGEVHDWTRGGKRRVTHYYKVGGG